MLMVRRNLLLNSIFCIWKWNIKYIIDIPYYYWIKSSFKVQNNLILFSNAFIYQLKVYIEINIVSNITFLIRVFGLFFLLCVLLTPTLIILIL